MRILIVDDDPLSSRMVQFLLTEQGYSVDLAENGRAAFAVIQRQEPDLILLDVNMPNLNGFDFCRKLRAQGHDFPVIFVTAKGELEDRLLGLSVGADDYICKPFQPAELSARVEAVLRRYRRAAPSTPLSASGSSNVGKLQIDTASLRVTLPDRRSVTLTPTEMKLLLQLTQHPGEPVQRADLMVNVWGDTYGGESNIVDVYVRRLRRKIERDPSRPTLIQAARGVGYKFAG